MKLNEFFDQDAPPPPYPLDVKCGNMNNDGILKWYTKFTNSISNHFLCVCFGKSSSTNLYFPGCPLEWFQYLNIFRSTTPDSRYIRCSYHLSSPSTA